VKRKCGQSGKDAQAGIRRMTMDYKFRVWDEETETMLYSDGPEECTFVVEDGKLKCYVPEVVDATFDEPEHVVGREIFNILQWTTLKDKNGKDIYRNDRIIFSVSKTQHYRGIVVWSDTRCGWAVQIEWEKQDALGAIANGYEMSFSKGNERLASFNSDCFDIEVIGNIHQNPEMLEAKP